MNKRPGHIKVTTEPGYCSFCDRTRNLRREEHQLGTFVRTVVTCETCHRTLSSTMGVASADPLVNEKAPAVETPAAAKATPDAKAPPAKRTVATTTRATSPKPKATKARTTGTR